MESKAISEQVANLKVLHIATELYGIGGHARMVANWITGDPDNVHSLALTAQHYPIPEDVAKAVAASDGRLEQINLRPGGMLQWAKRLQQVIATTDLVVLHIHNMDIVPLIALSGLENRPRCLLVNHGDHQFWLGSSIVDLVVSTRRSGLQLCVHRRGVEPERNVLLPLCLKPKRRINSRSDAKRLLQLSEEAVVVVTVARAVKFRDIGGENFIEALVPALAANPLIHMIVVGPRNIESWKESISKVPSQVRVLAETQDTQLYFDAADIYLDSFPFVSITSLLEAGAHGLPLVTRSAFGSDCGVMAADSPGLDGALVQTSSLVELQDTILRLSIDSEWRTKLGEQTRAQILATNVGENWQRELGSVYRSALRLDLNTGKMQPSLDMSDLDLFIPFVFDDMSYDASPSLSSRSAWATELVLKAAPLGWRMRNLGRLILNRDLKGSPLRAIIPAWLSARVRKGFKLDLK
jgi:glycosyltransferase involved in cell wall biosynthesis